METRGLKYRDPAEIGKKAQLNFLSEMRGILFMQGKNFKEIDAEVASITGISDKKGSQID